jgi:predicted RNA-binding Zn-ribbon protein involved in translation (DUF1610 family)
MKTTCDCCEAVFSLSGEPVEACLTPEIFGMKGAILQAFLCPACGALQATRDITARMNEILDRRFT